MKGMSPVASPHRHRLGSLLVVLQFVLLLALALMALPAVLHGAWSIAGLVVLAASGTLGIWTLLHNRLGNFNIHPEPKSGGQLVVSGPYRYLRHPMYSAVLLLAAALAVLALSWQAWAAWLTLACVLWLKAGMEERWLCEQYPDYATYCQHSKRFVPWLL